MSDDTRGDDGVRAVQPEESLQQGSHWSSRPETVQWLKRAGVAALVLVVLADVFVGHKVKFGVVGTFGFGAWFGMLAAVALVVVATALGRLLKRSEGYYDR